jgi:hypothetical protein
MESSFWTIFAFLVVVAFWAERQAKASGARYLQYIKHLENIEHNIGQILLRIDSGHLACRPETKLWREHE